MINFNKRKFTPPPNKNEYIEDYIISIHDDFDSEAFSCNAKDLVRLYTEGKMKQDFSLMEEFTNEMLYETLCNDIDYSLTYHYEKQEFTASYLIKYEKPDGNEEITVYAECKVIYYAINEEDKVVVGNKRSKEFAQYILKLQRPFITDSMEQICPTCGMLNNVANTLECTKCGTPLNKWKLSSIMEVV